MKLAISLNHKELSDLQTPIIVEMWNKKKEGRVKRAWLKEFNEQERKAAARLYPQFYQWHLVTGLPRTRIFMPHTLSLVRRVVHFFGTI